VEEMVFSGLVLALWTLAPDCWLVSVLPARLVLVPILSLALVSVLSLAFVPALLSAAVPALCATAIAALASQQTWRNQRCSTGSKH
jgi:hypothetical protein